MMSSSKHKNEIEPEPGTMDRTSDISSSSTRKVRRSFDKPNSWKNKELQRPASEEKRGATRIELVKRTEVRSGRFGLKKDPNAIMNSPSVSGVGLETILEVEEGAVISFKMGFITKDGERWCLKGEVVRKYGKLKNLLFHYGIKFDQEYGDYDLWKSFVSKKVLEQKRPIKKFL